MTFCIGRRDFITLVGGAAVWPLAARAQQSKPPTIGFLGTSTSVAMNRRVTAFVQRLRELGWIEGRTVAIEYRCWPPPARFATRSRHRDCSG
jgi:hypothetical protein